MHVLPMPQHYPNTPSSAIADARRFTFDTVGAGKMHIPARFPDGSKVTALCGTYGFAGESESRGIHWASGYLAGEFDCPACSKRV